MHPHPVKSPNLTRKFQLTNMQAPAAAPTNLVVVKLVRIFPAPCGSL
jgi:hypothetical protein